MYGFGCLVSPFVATAIASTVPSRWTLFYCFPLGLSILNIVSVVVAFRESMTMVGRTSARDINGESAGRNKTALMELRQVLKLRDLWIISLFYFLYLGVCFAAGGEIAFNASTLSASDTS
jgi:nitrate/nitrite transporter NarK